MDGIRARLKSTSPLQDGDYVLAAGEVRMKMCIADRMIEYEGLPRSRKVCCGAARQRLGKCFYAEVDPTEWSGFVDTIVDTHTTQLRQIRMLRNARINGNTPFLVCFCSFAPVKSCPFCPAITERGKAWPVLDSWIGRRDVIGKGCDCEACIALEFESCTGGVKGAPFGVRTYKEDGDDDPLPEGTEWSAATFNALPRAAQTVDSCIDHLLMQQVLAAASKEAFQSTMTGAGDQFPSYGGITAAAVMQTIESHLGPAWMAAYCADEAAVAARIVPRLQTVTKSGRAYVKTLAGKLYASWAGSTDLRFFRGQRVLARYMYHTRVHQAYTAVYIGRVIGSGQLIGTYEIMFDKAYPFLR